MAKLILTITLLFFLSISVQAQGAITEFKLNEKQIRTINNQTSAKKKLRLYRKFFHKDSIIHARGLKRQTDSLREAYHIYM